MRLVVVLEVFEDKGKVGIKANGSLMSQFVVERANPGEGKPFVVMGKGIIGVKANGLLKGDKRLVVALEICEGNPFAVVGGGKVGIEANDPLIGS